MSTKTDIIQTKRACIGCSSRMHEKKNVKEGSSAGFHSNKNGLICCSCGSLICNDCVKQLYPAVEAKLSTIHKSCAPYIKALKHAYSYSKSKESEAKNYRQVPNFIGNCCFIKNLRSKEMLLEKSRWENLESIEVKPKKRKTIETPSMYSTMGGHMCLPEFDVIVETDFDCMDVIGLGGEKVLDGNDLKPCYHFVIDELNASQLESQGVRPLFNLPSDWVRVDEKIRIPYPHNNKPKPYQCSIFFAPKKKMADLSSKGSNKITGADATSMYYFSTAAVHKADITKTDITIVIGYDSGSNMGSILLFRYHNHLRSPNLKDGQKRELYNDIKLLLSNNGLERRRSGGSSGFLQYSKQLMKMMATSNSSPKNSKGVVYLPHSNNLGLHLFYFDKVKNDVKYFSYTNPQVGGSFTSPQKLLMKPKYKFLIDFIMTKPLCSKIIFKLQKNLNRRQDLIGCDLPSVFCPAAVTTELMCVERTISFVNKFYPKAEGEQRKLIFYSLFSKWFLKFTLITHPAGRHFDFFSDNSPSLENRICFGFKVRHGDDLSGDKVNGLGYGRGGLGKDIFTFALLDWRGCARQRMCIWSDPRNAACSNSLYDIQKRENNSYIDPPELTPRLWRIFMRENPSNISVPDGVILAKI